MENDKKKKIIRIIVLIIFLVAMGVITYFFIPMIKSLRTQAGREALQTRVKSYGVFAPGIYFLICLVQVVVAMIPGEPLELAGGVLFGGFNGFFLCILGITLGEVVVYYLVKLIGKPFIDAMMSKETYNKFKILNDEKRLETVIFILFLIPGTPKDALTYFVPLTKIKPSKYFVLSSLARVPSVISSTIVGANISKGNWAVGIVVFGVIAVIGLVGILFNGKIMNLLKNRTKKINDNIKNHKKDS